ncbi:MAG: hypothetical protein LBQ35_07160 [Spirochaetaceae bacterium]|jgi:hypothetical protein|nr:hypothetical protein [Spirochaetaceae bacterium]
MPSLTPKENYLRALRHEETEYLPCGLMIDVDPCGVFPPVDCGNKSSNFIDGFGVRWVTSDSAVGGQIPAPGEFLLRDITNWKKVVTLPDLRDYDWQKLAGQEMACFRVDRQKRALGFYSPNGIFVRLVTLMGFENALIALVEEPDACNEFFAAVTSYKIKLAERVARYYKADTFTIFDDMATRRNMLMSPDTYRKLIKPHHKRLNDAIRNYGMLPIQHTCGKADACVEDYIETGAAAWNAVQPCNDIAGILDKYGGRIAVEGGWDANGNPGRRDATTEEIRAEVERCFREYGGREGYIFMQTFLVSAAVSREDAARNAVIVETINKLRFAGIQKVP